jgi:AcrR family transcriptional regulator
MSAITASAYNRHLRQTRQAIFGRPKQRARTRNLLVQTAGKLIQAGGTPTVTQVADAAEVSRRTAYRYFPSGDHLLADASLDLLRPVVARALEGLPDDVELRLEKLVRTVQRLALENEAALRTVVRLALDQHIVRGGRRVEWIEAALAPVRPLLRRSEFQRLVSALTLCVGIEAILVLRDIRGVEGQKSIEVSLWAAKELLRATLASKGRQQG